MIDLTHAPLPDSEIREMVRRYRAGDMEAANRIIEHNDRLVFKIAMRYYSTGSTGGTALEDLMQWGRVGLWRALKDFRLDNGNNFSTYAYAWVRLYISRYGKRQGNDLALSYQASERKGKIGEARARFVQLHHREPTLHELADATGMKASYIESLRTTIISLDAEVNNHDAADRRLISDGIPDPAVNVEEEAGDLADVTFNQRIRQHLDCLPENWRAVIVARYGLDGKPPRTQKVIGRELGLSHERIRQIEAAALMKLREIMRV